MLTKENINQYQLVAAADHPQLLLRDIEALEQRAHRLGLHIAARGINRAKNAAGWEMAGNLEMADKSLHTEHA